MGRSGMREAAREPCVLAVGLLPPPHNGMSTATEYLIEASQSWPFKVVLLDIADRRGLRNVGRLDVWNVVLAVRHALEYQRRLASLKPALVYVPIAQNMLGFLRDCVFL